MLELRLKRSNKTYRENEVISGFLIINHPQGDFSHSGITLTLQGIVNLQLSSKNVGRFALLLRLLLLFRLAENFLLPTNQVFVTLA